MDLDEVERVQDLPVQIRRNRLSAENPQAKRRILERKAQNNQPLLLFLELIHNALVSQSWDTDFVVSDAIHHPMRP